MATVFDVTELSRIAMDESNVPRRHRLGWPILHARQNADWTDSPD